ncbi:N utilization substance protein B [Lactococcus hodotermopsidis]|uniref:Transcription antitermination protein NusB n=1 Tax=Pseudolactococcus hodotermopsidis TaxID=2709157 RepID=A0A6A0BCS5_9LACT|nr:transcription antitermination factor NusB [Lactococcus hodotermopsidis]GFH41617.1 N utilization substance protein B [Lactococcus hodotermopsidis]
MPTKPLSQHEIRIRAVQTLYLLENQADETVENALDFALGYDGDVRKVSEIPAFLTELIYGVRTKKAELDEKITTHLAKNWSVKRLAPINRVILRLGTFEICFAETPRVVAINEAIELAKAFNDEKDAKFINAILTKIEAE